MIYKMDVEMYMILEITKSDITGIYNNDTMMIGLYNNKEDMKKDLKRIGKRVMDDINVYRYCMIHNRGTGIKEVDELIKEYINGPYWRLCRWVKGWELEKKLYERDRKKIKELNEKIYKKYGEGVFDEIKGEIKETMMKNKDRWISYEYDGYCDVYSKIYYFKWKGINRMRELEEYGEDSDNEDSDDGENWYEKELEKKDEDIKRLKAEIEHLKYKPGGVGYEEVKNHYSSLCFEELNGKRASEAE